MKHQKVAEDIGTLSSQLPEKVRTPGEFIKVPIRMKIKVTIMKEAKHG